MADLNKDALTCVPLHVGFIMDGNGRWAKKRGLPRKAGHSQGAKVFRRTVEDCRDIGIKYCTFYAFSTENWKRPKDEVDAIMKLLVKYLDDIRSMAQKNTRIIKVLLKMPTVNSLSQMLREITMHQQVNIFLKMEETGFRLQKMPLRISWIQGIF